MPRKYACWISPALLSALCLTSATFHLTQGDTVRQLVGQLGFLVSLLIAVKLLGVAAILSRAGVALSDLACSGMFFHMLLALSAHLNHPTMPGPFRHPAA